MPRHAVTDNQLVANAYERAASLAVAFIRDGESVKSAKRKHSITTDADNWGSLITHMALRILQEGSHG